MNKASVEARKKELEDQKQQLFANLNAIIGALQDCEYWLSVLDAEAQREALIPSITPSEPPVA